MVEKPTHWVSGEQRAQRTEFNRSSQGFDEGKGVHLITNQTFVWLIEDMRKHGANIVCPGEHILTYIPNGLFLLADILDCSHSSGFGGSSPILLAEESNSRLATLMEALHSPSPDQVTYVLLLEHLRDIPG